MSIIGYTGAGIIGNGCISYSTVIQNNYSTAANLLVAYSMRVLVPTYTGPVINVRRSTDNVTANFYTDTKQTYFTTGIGGTGITYASWIGAATGYITKWYDQSGKANDASNNITGTTQPTVAQVASQIGTNYYVVQWNSANSTVLKITTPFLSNTVFSQFYNSNTIAGTIISCSGDFGLRTVSLSDNDNGWYTAPKSGEKRAYVNNVSFTVGTGSGTITGDITYNSAKWNRLSLYVSAPSTSIAGGLFNKIGQDGYANDRSTTGYMVEIFCHNTLMTVTDMQQYYANRLF